MIWSLSIHYLTPPQGITEWPWRDAVAVLERIAERDHAEAEFRAQLHGMKLKN